MEKDMSKSFLSFQNEQDIIRYEQNMLKNSVVFFFFA